MNHVDHALPPRRPARARRAVFALPAAVLLFLIPAPSVALAPPLGEPAPTIKLPDIAGNDVDLSASPRSTQVVIFGDLAHEGVRTAVKAVVEVAGGPRHAGQRITTALVVAHNDTPAELRDEAAAGGFPRYVLHDQDRRTFGAYRILVMPTVVVIDPAGKVAYSMSGPVQLFRERLDAALLRCEGVISEEQFKRIVAPDAPAPGAPTAARVDRLVNLGNELLRHGLYETAEARFKEALEIAPGNVQAHLGVASVMVRTNRLDGAEAEFRAAQDADKESVDAAIGLATVDALRGGEAIRRADAAASEIVARYPSLPKARFLMGIVYERQGNCTAALAEFRHAAELAIGN